MFIYNQPILRCRVLHEKQTASQLRNFPHFMEPEDSLPHLQAPAIYSYPEPDQSSPCTPNYFFNIHFNVILHSTLSPSKWSLFLKFSQQNISHLYSGLYASKIGLQGFCYLRMGSLQFETAATHSMLYIAPKYIFSIPFKLHSFMIILRVNDLTDFFSFNFYLFTVHVY